MHVPSTPRRGNRVPVQAAAFSGGRGSGGGIMRGGGGGSVSSHGGTRAEIDAGGEGVWGINLPAGQLIAEYVVIRRCRLNTSG